MLRHLRMTSVVGLIWLALSALWLPVARAEEEAAPAGGGEKSLYMELKPSFVANYGGPGPIHYLKVDIALRLSDTEGAGTLVDHHLPYIRHVLVMLLSRQTDDTIATMESKEKLRADALAQVNKFLQEEEGKVLVDDLLFTNFVVQR